jgi:para-aminobenzoate synthetase/4-amino-4-deoxychorismate lyase
VIPFDVVLRTPRGGPWRAFRNPVAVVRATRPADVIACLAEVDRFVRVERCYAAGFVTYEAAAAFGLPVQPTSEEAIPLVCFGIYPPDRVISHARLPPAGPHIIGEWRPTADHASYLRAMHRIKSRIEAGDTYQINFTFQLHARFEGDPLGLLCALDEAHAGLWGGYVDAGRYAICSASPELFFSIDGDRVRCKPMKGAAPRGLSAAADRLAAERLRRSEKNRAENVMVVDVVRNDLGRIARTGSVEVASMFHVERYPLQWQMTSSVTAIAPGARLPRLFEALFPAGSVTGAPKHSSMAIIRELETRPRGVHTGAIGYFSPRDRGRFNVATRSITIDREAQVAEFGVGGGVVWDSVERDEYDECLLNASILLSAGNAPQSSLLPSALSHPAREHRHRERPPIVSYIVSHRPAVGLIETLRWAPGEGFARLDRHMDRLSESAACFAYECDVAAVREMLANAITDLRGPAKVRLLLNRDGAIVCEAVDLLDPVPDPLRVAIAADPVDPTNVFLYHQTTRREVYDSARASRPGADTVMLWNAAGEVTEATEANVVVEIDGRKVTPPVECGLLPGTFRAELLARGEIVEERVSVGSLQTCDRIWLVNSVRGWMKAIVVPA